MDRTKHRKQLDSNCPSFWLQHKQYLLKYNEEDMELIEFLVLEAYFYGKSKTT